MEMNWSCFYLFTYANKELTLDRLFSRWGTLLGFKMPDEIDRAVMSAALFIVAIEKKEKRKGIGQLSYDS